MVVTFSKFCNSKSWVDTFTGLKQVVEPSNSTCTDLKIKTMWLKPLLEWEHIFYNSLDKILSLIQILQRKMSAQELKGCVRYILSNFYFPPSDNPLKTMKNVFCFI